MEYERRPIKGFEDYEIDNVGNVFTNKKRGKLKSSDGKMSVRKNNVGYHQVALYKEGKVHEKLVHRLMWETFIDDIEEGMTIDHIDQDHTNNTLSNLQVMTASDNAKKAWDSRGRSTIKPIIKDWLKRGYSRKFIADNLGVTQSYVSMVYKQRR